VTRGELVRHEYLPFVIATLAALVHVVDEVFFAKEAYRAVPAIILNLVAVIFYPRLAPRLRGAAAVVFGSFWLGGVFTHWIPWIEDGYSPGDYTSIPSVLGGFLLLVMGVTILWRSRSEAAPAKPPEAV
jgi:apolipoprotein N-acyltransferase